MSTATSASRGTCDECGPVLGGAQARERGHELAGGTREPQVVRVRLGLRDELEHGRRDIGAPNGDGAQRRRRRASPCPLPAVRAPTGRARARPARHRPAARPRPPRPARRPRASSARSAASASSAWPDAIAVDRPRHARRRAGRSRRRRGRRRGRAVRRAARCPARAAATCAATSVWAAAPASFGRAPSASVSPSSRLGDEHGLGAQLAVHRRHDQPLDVAQDARHAPVRGRLVLEVELVERLLADRAQQRARVGLRQRGAKRCRQRVEQRQVGSHRAVEPRPAHADRHRPRHRRRRGASGPRRAPRAARGRSRRAPSRAPVPRRPSARARRSGRPAARMPRRAPPRARA